MPINLEIKVPIKNVKKLIKIVEENGGKLIYSSRQIDVYYKINNGRLKIRDSSGEKSIIFYDRKEDGSERWSNFQVMKVANPKLWINFFDNFLERFIVVDKYRTLYHLKNTRIHFDKVKNLGNFIELETKVVSNKRNARLEFEEICKLLNLDKNNQVLKSYSDLLRK